MRDDTGVSGETVLRRLVPEGMVGADDGGRDLWSLLPVSDVAANRTRASPSHVGRPPPRRPGPHYKGPRSLYEAPYDRDQGPRGLAGTWHVLPPPDLLAG